jgi:UDP-N-acetylglucosamine:LPS N-acetylglucosamine transferase
MKRAIATASFGGHWIQLLRLKPLFEKYETTYVSTRAELGEMVQGNAFLVINDSAAESKLKLIITFAKALIIVLRVRPHVVVSTGAAPGFALIFWGRIFGAKTVWVDSIANAEQMSRSGRLARRFSTLWLSQWQDVAEQSGAQHLGRVI